MSEMETKGAMTSGVENPKLDGIAVVEKTETGLSSFEIFERCINRAQNLISIEKTTEDIDAVSEQHYCDCYRAAIVLSISALDAFEKGVSQ